MALAIISQDRINTARFRSSFYITSIKWVLAVLLVLLLPYAFSAFINLIALTDNSESVNFFHIFWNKITSGIKSGTFLFIPISLTSAAYIDYLFCRGLNVSRFWIHGTFFIILLFILAMFTCIDINNEFGSNSPLSLHHDIINDILTYVSFVSIFYALGTKAFVIAFRNR